MMSNNCNNVVPPVLLLCSDAPEIILKEEQPCICAVLTRLISEQYLKGIKFRGYLISRFHDFFVKFQN